MQPALITLVGSCILHGVLAASDTLIIGMHSGEYQAAMDGPAQNDNGVWYVYSADTSPCSGSYSLPDNPWNPFVNGNIQGDESKDFQDWCGLQLPCQGNIVMGKDGICGKGQQQSNTEGTYYADAYDHGNGNKIVGRCVYTGTQSKNCATTGSDLYEPAVRCYFNGNIC